MIGVISNPAEAPAVEEFFQLFKTPWEFFRGGRSYDVLVVTTDDIPATEARAILVYGAEGKTFDKGQKIQASSRFRGACLNANGIQVPIYGDLLTFESDGNGVLPTHDRAGFAGLRLEASDVVVHRFGYDLFEEVAFLLRTGQPTENANVPTLDLHVALMRKSILDSGVGILEIPPVPAGHDFIVCLTHDIDFVGIRRHKFDHTMWGFLYRSSVGAFLDFLRGRLTFNRLCRRIRAAALLPLIYLGLAEDFWMPFEWYLKVEKGLSATYFLIPFKHRAGEKVAASHPERRATAYDVTDLDDWTPRLINEGCEIGVHGLDAWHSVGKGQEELARVAGMSGQAETGIRMHWLLRDGDTPSVLEQAGYAYDSTAGYNDAVGYLNGTHQVFRPPGSRTLLELPLHIQDGALFYRQRLDLSEEAARKLCQGLIQNAREFGGVLTLLWHDRSHGPERFWGEFYARLVDDLKAEKPWFTSAGRAAGWFRHRREVVFDSSPEQTESLVARCPAPGRISPPLVVRVHRPNAKNPRGALPGTSPSHVDVAWDGAAELDLSNLLEPEPSFAPTAST